MFAACLWQGLPELWLQAGENPGGTAGGLTGQWLLNKGAIQIGIYRPSRERRQPEDLELKQDVWRGGKEGVYAEQGALGGQLPSWLCGCSLSLGWDLLASWHWDHTGHLSQ